MPQASEELRAWAREKFGSLDAYGPEKFLKDWGYVLHEDRHWSMDCVSNYGDMTINEYMACKFLIEEWDYGGLKGVEP